MGNEIKFIQNGNLRVTVQVLWTTGALENTKSLVYKATASPQSRRTSKFAEVFWKERLFLPPTNKMTPQKVPYLLLACCTGPSSRSSGQPQFEEDPFLFLPAFLSTFGSHENLLQLASAAAPCVCFAIHNSVAKNRSCSGGWEQYDH